MAKVFWLQQFFLQKRRTNFDFWVVFIIKIEVLLICHTTKQLLLNVLVYYQWVDIEKNLIKTIWHLIKV
jgi:hypothetical protein